MPKHAHPGAYDSSWDDDGSDIRPSHARPSDDYPRQGPPDHGYDEEEYWGEQDAASRKKSKRERKKEQLTPLQLKSRKTRRILIMVITLLIALVGTVAYFAYMLYEEAQVKASQQAQQKESTDVDELKDGGEDPRDATTATTKRTEVPLLTELIGMKEDEAIKHIGRGAIVVNSSPVDEQGSPVKTEVKVSLSDEPGDTRSGNPTVYLGLDGAGVIVRVGYSAAVTTLGYGASSFTDAVMKDFIVENTLAEGGIALEPGHLELPQDKAEYTTYKDDSKTIVKEVWSFSGVEQIGGTSHEWSAVLRYDYTAGNATGNLSDTIRQIYIYVYVPSAATPPGLLPTPPASADANAGTGTGAGTGTSRN